MKQVVDTVRFQRGDDGLVDRGDGTRMAARKGDEVLVRLFDGAKALTQARQGLVLERDHSCHWASFTPATVNFLQHGRHGAQRAAIFAASRASLISARVPSLALVTSASSA